MIQRATTILREARNDEQGATIVEFALVAPFLVTALLGLFDMSYNIYTTSLLDGAIQKAARDSSIEGAGSAAAQIDARVTGIVKSIVPNSQVDIERMSYTNFSNVSQPEDYTDLNNNGACDDDEPFEDVNGNGMWDSDRGQQGTGGARDAVLYTVTVTYDRAFPMYGLIGLSDQVSSVSRTVLRNQPYAQQEHDVSVANCA